MFRLIVVLAALVFMSGCAAFDNSAGDPYEGFPDSEKPTKSLGGAYSGYFAGDMKLDKSTCKSLGETPAPTVALGIEVVQQTNQIGVTFDDGQIKVATLASDKATVMTEKDKVNHVYYLKFNKDKPDTIEGSCEVIEPDAAGQLGDACGSYTFTLKKGEKPAAVATKTE